MPKKSIYLKYREERDYAKYLKEFKKNTWLTKKVVRVQLERVDLKALMKKKKPSVPVSLPIKHFNKMRSTMNNNHNGQKELQTPKDKVGRTVRQDFGAMGPPMAPTTKLRMVRHPGVAALHDTTTKIKSIPIKPNLLPVNLNVPATQGAEKKSKKIETYTPSNAIVKAAKANVMPFQRNERRYATKRKPIKDNYGIADIVSSANSKEVGTNIPTDIIDTAAKANAMPMQKNDNIPIKRKPITENYGIADIVSYANSKEVGTNIPTDIIDTATKANVMPLQKNDNIPIKRKPIKENYGIADIVSPVNSKKVGTNIPTDIIDTAGKANAMPMQKNDNIPIKRKPIKENYGIADIVSYRNSKEVGTNITTDIIDTAAKANAMPMQKNDNIPIKRKPITENYGIADIVSYANSKEVGTNIPTDIIDTATKANIMPLQKNDNIPIKRKRIKENYGIADIVSLVNSKKVGTNISTDIIDTAGKANAMPMQKNDNIPIKRKPIKENYGIADIVSYTNSKEVGTNIPTDIIDTAAKANVMPLQKNDNIPIKRKPIKENYGIADIVSYANSKEVGTNIPTDIIDTATKANVMPLQKNDNIPIKRKPIKENYGIADIVSSVNSKKVGTNIPTDIIDTAAKANVLSLQKNDHIPIKRKPIKENYGIADIVSCANSKEVGNNIPTDIIDTAAKANVMPFRGDDHININYPQKNDTAEKANVMPHEIAHRKISFTSFKEVGTNTSTDIIDTGVILNKHISIKHKLPVPVVPTKKISGISHKDVRFVNSKDVGTNTPTDIINTTAKANERISKLQVNSANEVKRCLKALVITSTQTDKIPIVNETELQTLGIVTKSGVTNDELVDALESFKKVKELSKYNVTGVIDLDESADDNGAKLLELARFHSEKNKKAIYENCVRASTSTPTPIDLEQQKILEMRCKLINSMNYEQLKNIINSHNNKENSNKKRKTTESGENYDKANMDMEIDVLETQNIPNQPVTATPLPKPSFQKSTTQQCQMQPIKPQKQNIESSMPQLHSSPIQQIIRQDAHLEYFKQKMLQQQYLQELKQRNMHAKPNQPQEQVNLQLKNPQAQQPHSKSPQIRELYSKSPQFQQLHSKSPQIRELYSKSPQFQQLHSKSPPIRELYSKSPQFQQLHSKSPPIRELYSKSPQFQQLHSKSPQIRELYSKSPQFQQLHSKSPPIREAYSIIPQIQQPHSKTPHEQQPQSQPTELEEDLQHPLDRRIRIRDQQRTALPQEHYQYESASNGYQDPVFSQVPQTINSTQQPQYQLYPGDPRIQTIQSQVPHVMPSAPHMMSSYDTNLQTSSSSYPYQNNGYINQQYW